MSGKQTRSRRVADNYRRAPQKCQYVKVGAVCEMNGDKWQSSRRPVEQGGGYLPRSPDVVTDDLSEERSKRQSAKCLVDRFETLQRVMEQEGAAATLSCELKSCRRQAAPHTSQTGNQLL
ncbi:unnamed protein product [Pleuronectes platessa]|uniref:Uncharacterized protein n=1 Tax=Pleuronectes platessa TaxID=8262 RepID=A0A9N7ZFA8_PLEPL|nr:unnamed protein product [Pleuronectes platessa]